MAHCLAVSTNIPYDTIGSEYGATRRTDPRIAAQIEHVLRDAATIVNVGAGCGSYEPPSRTVVAVEPSSVMLAQRPPDAAPAVQAYAEALPFATGSFDAAMAILTVHYWSDVPRGLAELRRVARRRIVVVSWDQEARESFWLLREYFPAIADLERRRAIQSAEILGALGRGAVSPVPIPADCMDGFLGGFWRRPEKYLEPQVRAGMSAFHEIAPEDRDAGLERLADDLESGRWTEKFGDLLALPSLDVGYRLIHVEL